MDQVIEIIKLLDGKTKLTKVCDPEKLKVIFYLTSLPQLGNTRKLIEVIKKLFKFSLRNIVQATKKILMIITIIILYLVG